MRRGWSDLDGGRRQEDSVELASIGRAIHRATADRQFNDWMAGTGDETAWRDRAVLRSGRWIPRCFGSAEDLASIGGGALYLGARGACRAFRCPVDLEGDLLFFVQSSLPTQK